MEILVFDSYDQMSTAAANKIVEQLQAVKEPVFCPASGDSPVGIYKALVRQHNEKKIDVSNWYFLGLDEWIGLDKYDQGSCRHMLDRDLFNDLKIHEDRICFFEGKTNDPEKECDRIDKFIINRKGIDVAVLGLGMNGHVGMNEPGTSPFSKTHVADLDPMTKEVGQKYFTTPQQLSKGITLGIATLMKARHLVLVVSGKKKAAILQRVMEGDISEQVPATWLRNHPDCTLYADADAASLLNSYDSW
jgi:glucosamine-6-phosphate isomerase